MVSLRNLFRAIMGDVEAEPERGGWVVPRSDGSSLVDGLMPLDEFVHYFEINLVDDEDRVGFHTVGGLIFDLAGHIPRIGNYFHWYGYRLEVIDMDGNRVDQLLVSPRKAHT